MWPSENEGEERTESIIGACLKFEGVDRKKKTGEDQQQSQAQQPRTWSQNKRSAEASSCAQLENSVSAHFSGQFLNMSV